MLPESYNADKIRAQRAASPEASARKLASLIYPGRLKPFAKGFYNRDNMIESRFQTSILGGRPLQFVGFWGVGGKHVIDRHDLELLSELEAIQDTISKVYQLGTGIQLIIADEHGRFNGYHGFEDYLAAIVSQANDRGIISIFLSQLYREWGIKLPNPDKPIDRSSVYWHDWTKDRYQRQRTQLIESAARHNKKGLEPEQAAYYYWVIRHQEREPLSRSFAQALLLVNGSRELSRVILPVDMPHMYLKMRPVWFQYG